MKKLAFLASLTIGLVAGTGCSSQGQLALEASPEGAVYHISTLNGSELQSGRTPALLRLDGAEGYKAATYRVSLHQDGFDERQIIVENTLGVWYWGDVSLGRGEGVYIVDPVSGAIWKVPAGTGLVGEDINAQGQLEVVTLDSLPEAYRRQLLGQR